MAEGLDEYARAVPLNALTAHGFGPLARGSTKPATRLDSLRQSTQGAWSAVETAGVIGRRLLQVLAALGGSASREQLEFQTSTAAPGVLDQALGRLEAAELVVVRPDGGAEFATTIRAHVPGATISMADPNAITADALALVCRTGAASFSTVVTDGSDEIRFARNRQRFLAEQGYSSAIVDAHEMTGSPPSGF